jgi:hypothetical protein
LLHSNFTAFVGLLFKIIDMKKLVLALLFILPFHVLLAQSAKVIPASMSSTAKKEAAVEYNPQVKTETEADAKGKKVKCVPGCSGKKQCVKKACAKNTSPSAATEAKASEFPKK